MCARNRESSFISTAPSRRHHHDPVIARRRHEVHSFPNRGLDCGITIGAAAPAATFDLVAYLGLNPGSWAVLQDAGNGAISGYVTSQSTAGQVTQNWYRFVGGLWVFDSAETFAVSARRLSYTGTTGGVTSRDSVSINGLNRNEVKTWYNKIQDTADPTTENTSASHALVMIQSGDANPPFP